MENAGEEGQRESKSWRMVGELWQAVLWTQHDSHLHKLPEALITCSGPSGHQANEIGDYPSRQLDYVDSKIKQEGMKMEGTCIRGMG